MDQIGTCTNFNFLLFLIAFPRTDEAKSQRVALSNLLSTFQGIRQNES